VKVGVISKADHYGGGASRVAGEITSLLNIEGYDSDHWASWAGDGFNEHRKPLYGHHYTKVKVAHYAGKKLGFPELIPFELPFLLRKDRVFKYDLLHFHDLSSAISPLTLSYLSKKMPVVWTFHDCSPFTGGCLYPMGCEAYKDGGCRKCPQLGEWPIDSKLDFTGFLQNQKRKLADTGRVVYVAPSQWMADTAYESGLFKYKPIVISNGVDTELFKPQDKSTLKEEMKLPKDRVVILISAGSILDERKGTIYAIEALKRLQDLNPFLLLVGNLDDKARQLLEGFDYKEAGYIGDASILAQTYSAADLFLFCSLADNQPLSILETMSVATPMIGFKTGGISEMVVQNETGYLVDQKDVDSLTNILRDVLEQPSKLKTWGQNSRKRAVDFYSHEQFIKNHTELYERVLSGEFEMWRA